MTKPMKNGLYACLTLALATASASMALAEELRSPMQPGASTGVPAGALPPGEGVYLTFDQSHSWGKVVNGNGKQFGGGIKITEDNPTLVLLWEPGIKVLGANYGVKIVQPYQWTSVDAGVPQGMASSHGFMNTWLTPGILSWPLGGGLFVSADLSFSLVDGYYASSGSGANKSVAPASYANNYSTIEPSFAVSYLANGWNLTLHEIIDVYNTKNDDTNYQSGRVNYVDLTAAKTFGKWTAGLIGNYTQQLENDKKNGVVVPASPANSYGSQIQHISAGPMVGYNLGSAELQLRWLQAVQSKNMNNVSFLHFGISLPIY